MDGGFIVRDLYEDSITYDLINAAAKVLGKKLENQNWMLCI